MKNKIKVLLSCLMATLTIGAFTACGGSKKDDDSVTSEAPVTSEQPGASEEPGVSEEPETSEKPDIAEVFTVSFGGAAEAQEVVEGQKAQKPADPANYEEDGYAYTFDNWYEVGSETAYDFDTEVTGNLTLEARFTKTAIEYTVTFTHPRTGMILAAPITYTVENMGEIEFPAVPEELAMEGYTVAWNKTAADVTLGGLDVNPEWTAIEYTISFVNMQGMQVVEPITFTVETKDSVEFPVAPSAGEGWTASWDKTAADLTLADTTVMYVATMNVYTITFVNRAGMQVAEPITFTVETKDSVEFPVAPDAGEGWQGGWSISESELTLEDTTVVYVASMIEYTISFTHPKTGMILAAPIKYTVETMGEIEFPAVPEELAMEGYTVAWDKTEADVVLGDMNVVPVWTANTYKITYDANGGSVETETQDVKYGEEYTLATPTAGKFYQSFLGWVDEDGNPFESGAAWSVLSDMTLTAKYSNVITFDSMTDVPSYFQNGGRASLSIVEDNGGKVLQATSENNDQGNVRIKMTMDDLAKFFEDEKVQYLAFDLKLPAGATTPVSSIMYQSADQTSWTSYETGDPGKAGSQFDTTPTDAYKSYYLPRSVYEAWVANGKTEGRILNVQAGITQGASYWVDNFRPVTAEEYQADLFSFETGSLRNMTTEIGYCTPNYNQFHLRITGVDASKSHFTNEIVSEGMRAISFTKTSGESVIMFNHNTDTEIELAMRNAGYVAFDLYVPEGSDAKIVKNGFAWYGALKQGWNTIYEQVDATNNEIIRFTDSTASTYVMDNLRLLTEAEYNAAKFGFEAGGVIRDALGSDTTNGGYAYYYAGWDKANNKGSIQLNEGTGANDVATLSNVRFATENTHGGDYALAFDKKAGYMSLHMSSESTMYAALKNGFTFWIYSTTELNGESDIQIINGLNGKLNGGNGVTIPANTWTQVTVSAEDIHSGGRFLILQGATEGTIYLDDLQPLA